jgi:hypothetical protein
VSPTNYTCIDNIANANRNTDSHPNIVSNATPTTPTNTPDTTATPQPKTTDYLTIAVVSAAIVIAISLLLLVWQKRKRR